MIKKFLIFYMYAMVFAILYGAIALNIIDKIFNENPPEYVTNIMFFVCLALTIAMYLFFKKKKSDKIERLNQQKLELQQQINEEVSKEFEDGLQEISVDITLPKDEPAFFTISNIAWQEPRKVTTSVSYAGVSQRIKIAKGLSFKVGNIAPTRQTEEVYQVIESGELYFTNKKILLVGASGSKNIPLSKIVNIIGYTNGIELQRSTGKNVYFEMDYANSLRAKIILDNLIQ